MINCVIFGMEIFLIMETHIHGGSIRVFVGKKGKRPIDTSVKKFLRDEKESKLHEKETMLERKIPEKQPGF